VDETFGLLNVIVFVSFVVYLFGLIWWKVFQKAGYKAVWSLLMFVPVANLVALCVLAFGEWPIHRELARYRGEQDAAHRRGHLFDSTSRL
jgi:hypothetical protein